MEGQKNNDNDFKERVVGIEKFKGVKSWNTSAIYPAQLHGSVGLEMSDRRINRTTLTPYEMPLWLKIRDSFRSYSNEELSWV